MSVEGCEVLPQGLRVTFELQGSLPILREEYASPQVGRVILKGLFNQSAHIELLDGARYRTLSARRTKEFPNDLVYPVVHLPDRAEAMVLHTALRLPKGSVPKMRFTTTLDGEQYVYRQISAGRRGFELWDGMEMQKLVDRVRESKLMPDLNILLPVPALLVALFPWLDSQTIMYAPR